MPHFVTPEPKPVREKRRAPSRRAPTVERPALHLAPERSGEE